MENRVLTTGLRPTTRDERNFRLEGITRLPELSELPESFRFNPLRVKDQKNTDMCAAFASTLISELQEGIELSPEWQFAVATDDPDKWGLELRDVLKSLVKFGSLPANQAPYSIENKDRDFLSRISNWPQELFRLALAQKKKSFWEVSGPYDHFDNCRAAMWKFRNEKRGIVTGLIWSWPIFAKILEGVKEKGFGHAVALIGWENDKIIMQNSAGEDAGDKGLHYLSRETVNFFVEQYEAYMVLDISREDAERMIDFGIKLEDPWWKDLIKALVSVFLPSLKLWK